MVLPLSLIYIGGLESLKLAVLISALPLVFVYIMMAVSLFFSLRDHK